MVPSAHDCRRDARPSRGWKQVDALDSWSALVLAEHLNLPLFTASDEVDSDRVKIHRPW